MNIRFKVKGSDLNAVLAVVKTVTPREFDRQKAPGFLFVIRGTRGHVYSRDSIHVSRASFDLLDCEGEGAFIYPAKHANAFAFFDNKEIEFHVTQSGESVLVRYDAGSGVGGERSSFESKFMTTCDKELDDSSNPHAFSAAALREALSLAKGFQPSDSKDDDDPRKTIQVYDKSFKAPDPKDPSKTAHPFERADGYMYATNGSQAFHLECSDFVGKALSIHARHVPLLQQFLGFCKGAVTITTGVNMTFARDADSDRVLGWTHATKQHSKFAYYALKIDHVVGLVDRDDILRAIAYMQSEMEDKSVRIRVVYDDSNKNLQLQIPAEGTHKGFSSWRIPIVVEDTENRKSFTANAHIDQFKALFDGVKGSRVQVRFHLLEGDEKKKARTMMRSIDEFVLDKDGKVVGGSGTMEIPEGSVTCKVTRFTPSYD